jgi:hypothetical protein
MNFNVVINELGIPQPEFHFGDYRDYLLQKFLCQATPQISCHHYLKLIQDFNPSEYEPDEEGEPLRYYSGDHIETNFYADHLQLVEIYHAPTREPDSMNLSFDDAKQLLIDWENALDNIDFLITIKE